MMVKEVELVTLQPFEHNAKIHTPEQVEVIAKSIKKYGWTQPIVIDENYTILVGHGRAEAAKLLGLKLVPCNLVSGLSLAEKMALNAFDNKITLDTTFDTAKLNDLFKELRESDFDMAGWGWSAAEMSPAVDMNIAEGKGFEGGSIKQMVIFLSSQEFDDAMVMFDKVQREDPKLDNHTAIFLHLLDNFEKNYVPA